MYIDLPVKFQLSRLLKTFNKVYHRNYTLQDVSDVLGVSRRSLSNLTSSSSFKLIYNVCYCLYEFYPDSCSPEFDFYFFLTHLVLGSDL